MPDSDRLDQKAAPNGFAPTNSRGAFTLHNGPTYRASAEGDLRSGFWVLDRHCNGMGFLHGGMTSAFADSSLAWAIWSETQRMSVTLKLTLEYFDIVHEGTWLEARPAPVVVNGEVAHAQADLVTDAGKLAARADAVFRLLRKRH